MNLKFLKVTFSVWLLIWLALLSYWFANAENMDVEEAVLMIWCEIILSVPISILGSWFLSFLPSWTQIDWNQNPSFFIVFYTVFYFFIGLSQWKLFQLFLRKKSNEKK